MHKPPCDSAVRRHGDLELLRDAVVAAGDEGWRADACRAPVVAEGVAPLNNEGDVSGGFVAGVNELEARAVTASEKRRDRFNERGQITVATARRALSNGDGSEVQLFGDAVVTRQPGLGPGGQRTPRIEVRGEFLHFFANTEQLKSNRPVILERDADRFTGDNLDFNNLSQQLQLSGRVRGTIVPSEKR